MFRFLQVKENKPVMNVVAAAQMVTGTVVDKTLADDTVAAATSGLGEYFVDAPKDYTGLNAAVNPSDADSTTIASAARCIVVPTAIGERYATSQATVTTADVGDPLNVSNGSLVKAASESAYQWIYGGNYVDPTGRLKIVEKVAPSTAPATRTMTYDGNGGTGAMLDSYSPYYVGKKITVKECGYVAPAFKDFVDWDTAANGSGTNYDPGDLITVASANIKLYAQYEDTHTKLVFNANTGTGTMTDTSKYYVDDVITVPVPTFTPPESKEFSKWNTAAAGTGTDYAPDDEITVTSEMIGAATTLYAIWADT